MARKNSTRAAQGSGTIRKKTVTRNGKPYTYWEARVTTGRETAEKMCNRQEMTV